MNLPLASSFAPAFPAFLFSDARLSLTHSSSTTFTSSEPRMPGSGGLLRVYLRYHLPPHCHRPAPLLARPGRCDPLPLRLGKGHPTLSVLRTWVRVLLGTSLVLRCGRRGKSSIDASKTDSLRARVFLLFASSQAAFTAAQAQNRIYAYLCKKNGDKGQPEYRVSSHPRPLPPFFRRSRR